VPDTGGCARAYRLHRPAGIDDLSPLFDVLYDRNILKVFHACSQDLEIFAHLRGEVPGPIFDTQLAAPLLGLPEQMGYANFVREMLGVSLDKAQTRTDWSRRPLDKGQLRYAADDVRYLAEIFPRITASLEKMGRLEWLKEELDACENIERYVHGPGTAWHRIKGLEKLRPRALSVLQLLAGWRETTAQERNLPRNWVLKDDVMIDIARMAPDDTGKLEKIRNLPARTIERHGRRIIDLVNAGLQRQPEPLPPWKKRQKPDVSHEALADVLQAYLRLQAEEFRINSAVLASRKDLVAMVAGDEDIPLLHGWRRKMVGSDLLALRDGRMAISVKDGKLVVSAASGS